MDTSIQPTDPRQEKSDWYQQKFGDLVMNHGIEVCFMCQCRGSSTPLHHSRAHAHCDSRKICLSNVPTTYGRFLTALHEIGHIVAENASYQDNVPRALAEHNATEWAYTEMRKLGLPIKRKHKAKYDWYIGNKIARGLRRGLQHVPSVLRKYSVVG
jgi:hypothetical protein